MARRRCRNGTRKNKSGTCVSRSTRCKNGSRKVRSGPKKGTCKYKRKVY